jgi:uncharacterized membrane protein HdeD (DUF308 family)
MTARIIAAGSIAAGSRSARASAGLARNWPAVGLRAIAAGLFGVVVLESPSATLASLLLMFIAYLAADGAFAIVAGVRAARRGERWWSLMLEGILNLAAASVLLAWPAIAITPFIKITSDWAVVTGVLLIAAASRLSVSHGRGLMVLAGALSAGWGVLSTAPDISDARTMGLWLVGYALVFGGTFAILTGRLRSRARKAETG